MTHENEARARPDIAAAIRGGDPAQKMDDEIEMGASTLAQAEFWAKVYDEIVVMETEVLARVHKLMDMQSLHVRREVQLSNVPVIAAQLTRFRIRHDAWQGRVRELQEAAS
jgi:hypothetical protein